MQKQIGMFAGKCRGSFISIVAFLLMVACSIKPLYEESSHANKKTSFCDVDVAVIAERDGQKLRSYLVDTLRDIRFLSKKYRLVVKLSNSELQFAISSDGNAKRVLFIYTADVKLYDDLAKHVVLQKQLSVSTTNNVAYSHGEVIISLYARHNSALLKELSHRIVENIKMVTKNET
jgi:hypothetical protein